MASAAITEWAFAKINLVLHVGRLRPDGLHELCSLFASIDLADRVELGEAAGGRDALVCPGVEGPNIAGAALSAFRAETGRRLPPLEVRIEKRIPVSGGLGGGSADAAAVLRAANQLAGEPLELSALRALGATIGSDVPSQVEPRHAIVTGAGETVEPVALPPLALVLLTRREGLSTAQVYAEADRLGRTRAKLDPSDVRALVESPRERLLAALDNDLQPAALSLRPELGESLEALLERGARGALVSGSGPTVFGVFDDRATAAAAAADLDGAIVAETRGEP